MYDAVAEAMPLAQTGKNQKKALVIISDGNDTSSVMSVREVKQQIRDERGLVYAIGIDGEGEPVTRPRHASAISSARSAAADAHAVRRFRAGRPALRPPGQAAAAAAAAQRRGATNASTSSRCAI